jgi:uncharacterized repeat protein (TIGR03843 family)
MSSAESETGGTKSQSTARPEAEPAEESVRITAERALAALERGSVRERGLLPYSSNHSFLVVVRDDELALPAVYKPQRGESPLWDFELGTLCKRERAAWVVSNALGWDLIPPTVLRSASRGLGSVQFYVEHEEEAHYFTVQQDARYADAFRRLALFDFITNNADRKSGHCLVGRDGRIWAIDHGLCFHAEHKLRTVIWEFSAEPIEADLLSDLQLLHEQMCELGSDKMDGGRATAHGDEVQEAMPEAFVEAQKNEPVRELCSLLSATEQRAFAARVRTLVRSGCYPSPDPQRRNYPWPPV